MKRPALLRPSYFLWVPVALGLYAGFTVFGLPHALFSYRFDLRAGGDQWNPADRQYTRCTFLGPYGAFIIFPENGTCPWVVFRRRGDAGGGQ